MSTFALDNCENSVTKNTFITQYPSVRSCRWRYT